MEPETAFDAENYVLTIHGSSKRSLALFAKVAVFTTNGNMERKEKWIIERASIRAVVGNNILTSLPSWWENEIRHVIINLVFEYEFMMDHMTGSTRVPFAVY